jgi:hypothetical protein
MDSREPGWADMNDRIAEELHGERARTPSDNVWGPTDLKVRPCHSHVSTDGQPGGITGTHGVSSTCSDLERRTSADRVPKSSKLVVSPSLSFP